MKVSFLEQKVIYSKESIIYFKESITFKCNYWLSERKYYMRHKFY